MLIGAVTKCFGGASVSEVAELFALCGLNSAELCFCQSDLDGWRYNLCGKSTLPSSDEVYRAVNTFKKCGVTVSAIGLYSCLWSGEESGLSESVVQACEYFDLARESGVGIVTTHTGTLRGTVYRPSYSEKALSLLQSGLADICIEAEKRGLVLSVETSMYDVVDSYDGFCRLRAGVEGYIGRSGMLKYTYSSKFGETQIPEEEIALYHIRDVSSDGRFYERFGCGVLDFSSVLKKAVPSGKPIILEYVNSGSLGVTVQELLSEISNSIQST